MKDLRQIDTIGGIDADNDELLMQCFQNHEAFTQVLSLKKYVILGRKGTGKTAIYKKILSIADGKTFTFGHPFSDYPWHYHDKQVKIGVPDFDKYTHSWKYLCLLTISKILLNVDQSLPYDDDSLDKLTLLDSFVKDTYGTRNPEITNIFVPTKNINLKSNFQIDLGCLKAGISPSSIPMEELPTIVQEVNLNLLDCVLSSLNPNNKYFVLFDQLDLGFDPQNPNYNNRLIGLLIAAKEINNKAKEYGKSLNICIFLRDDIYNKLKFEDKNKITQGYTTYIEWDVRGNHTLKELIEKRLDLILKTNEESIKWEDVFDENQLMTGKQSKYAYITDRTFLRPRDIIQFCNEIISQHKKSPIDNDGKITNKEINDAKVEYSRYFLEELDDEIHKHIPEYEKILEIIKKIGYYQFSLENFTEAFHDKMNLFDNTNIAPVELLKKMFEFSIIGYYKAGGMGYGGSEYIFKYKDSRNQFEENAKSYRVHLGFIEALGLKRSSK